MEDFRQKIARIAAQNGKPFAVSLDNDTHIFHFAEDGNWEREPAVFVNRNGHHFRVVRSGDTCYFARMWHDLDDFSRDPTALRRGSMVDLIKLCGVGSQRKGAKLRESISFFPSTATRGRRKVGWRGAILEYHGGGAGRDDFRLMYNGAFSPSFTGKPWESADAARWCLATVAPNITPGVAAPVNPVIAAQDAAVLEELDGAGIWGIF